MTAVRAELVAIYGRRRVGKTYLVDETFAGRLAFRHAGLSPEAGESKGLLKQQLEQFYHSLELFGMEKTEKPHSWMERFPSGKFCRLGMTAADRWYFWTNCRGWIRPDPIL